MVGAEWVAGVTLVMRRCCYCTSCSTGRCAVRPSNAARVGVTIALTLEHGLVPMVGTVVVCWACVPVSDAVIHACIVLAESRAKVEACGSVGNTKEAVASTSSSKIVEGGMADGLLGLSKDRIVRSLRLLRCVVLPHFSFSLAPTTEPK